jgi:class 3 adenylate cyclase
VASCPACAKELPGEFPFCPFCGAALATAPEAREQRKVVTVLFCDVTGSTELGEKLDPETLRTLLARYFEEMKAIIERHGGSVEKFIGPRRLSAALRFSRPFPDRNITAAAS